MISGSNSFKSYVPYTGLASFKVVAVNPSNEEYLKITGKELPYELTYDTRDNYYLDTQKPARPVNFLLHNEELNIYEFARFNIFKEKDVTSKGSLRVMNQQGIPTFTSSIEALKTNDAMKWYSTDKVVVLEKGLFELYSFIQKWVKFDNRAKDVDFLSDMESNGITAEKLFKGDFSGLKSVIKWANDNKFTIALPLVVRKREKDDKVMFIQEIFSANPEVYFMTDKNGNVTTKSVEKFQEIHEKKVSQGFKITSRLFTFGLQPFVESECINYEPEQTGSNWADVGVEQENNDDLPF